MLCRYPIVSVCPQAAQRVWRRGCALSVPSKVPVTASSLASLGKSSTSFLTCLLTAETERVSCNAHPLKGSPRCVLLPDLGRQCDASAVSVHLIRGTEKVVEQRRSGDATVLQHEINGRTHFLGAWQNFQMFRFLLCSTHTLSHSAQHTPSQNLLRTRLFKLCKNRNRSLCVPACLIAHAWVTSDLKK